MSKYPEGSPVPFTRSSARLKRRDGAFILNSREATRNGRLTMTLDKERRETLKSGAAPFSRG